MRFPIELYARDAQGNDVGRGVAVANARWRRSGQGETLSQREFDELQDAVASAANDWLEERGLDVDGGLAARVPAFEFDRDARIDRVRARLAALAEDCGYNEDDEEGSVESLINYKDALEEILGRLLIGEGE